MLNTFGETNKHNQRSLEDSYTWMYQLWLKKKTYIFQICANSIFLEEDLPWVIADKKARV